ncbi:MAG: hypothetical protein GYB25_07440 [Rhodobacteraceae bacterium]|nr:hypothetical protein [Paracoccaceae bacterium]
MSKQNLRRRVRNGLMLVCVAAFAMGCATARDKMSNKEKITFDGHYFITKIDRPERKVRDHFMVYVRNPHQSLKAAREAGRYEAVKYCIKEYGTSQIDWIRGPDVEDAGLAFDNERLVLEGTCKP